MTATQGDARLDAQADNAMAGTLVRPVGSRWGRKCPHCKGPTRIRTSSHITENYVEITRVCKNVFCGFIWIDLCYGARFLSASMIPDLGVSIPRSKHINKDRVIAALSEEASNPTRKPSSGAPAAQAAMFFDDPNDTSRAPGTEQP